MYQCRYFCIWILSSDASSMSMNSICFSWWRWTRRSLALSSWPNSWKVYIVARLEHLLLPWSWLAVQKPYSHGCSCHVSFVAWDMHGQGAILSELEQLSMTNHQTAYGNMCSRVSWRTSVMPSRVLLGVLWYFDIRSIICWQESTYKDFSLFWQGVPVGDEMKDVGVWRENRNRHDYIP